MLKTAYREQAKKYHPDAPRGDEAKFKSIAEAFEFLSKVGSGPDGIEGTPFRKSEKFQFDESDPNARWAQMKSEFESANRDTGEPNTFRPSSPPVHLPTEESIVPLFYRHWILFLISITVIIFRREIFPFLPEKEEDEYAKINERYKQEKKERLTNAIIAKINRENNENNK